MSDYPKRITEGPEWFLKLQDAIYFHERERLGMLVDPDVPKCNFCERPMGCTLKHR